jgi:uncharacterized protein (DUF362 family)/Pyruvate/2-oxoacid:ferredoxin oxidoreductase delta subunit
MAPEVAIVVCRGYSNEDVYNAVKKAVTLAGGIERFVKKGARVLVKPNLLSAKPAQAAVTTHPTVVRAVIKLVKEAGGVPFVGDSPGFESAHKVAKRCGVLDIIGETQAGFMELATPVVVEGRKALQPAAPLFRRFEISKEALEADVIINLPKLKTHAQMLLTMGVKNIFGCVPGAKKAQWHFSAGKDPLSFASMLIDLFIKLKPALTVMDAVVAMEGNGPSSGAAKKTGFIAASSDAFALDSTVAGILGKTPQDVAVLKKAKERGLLAREIKTLGDGVAAVEFEFPPLASVDFADFLPGFLRGPVRKALTTRPEVRHRSCTLCSTCESVCPSGVITKNERIVIDHDGCIRCYCCQEMCPQGAITVREGWLRRIF